MEETVPVIAALGDLTRLDDQEDTLISRPLAIPLLFGARLPIEIEGYEIDPKPQDFVAAVTSLLACDDSVLEAAADALYAYSQDCAKLWAGDPGLAKVARREDAWRRVRFTGHPLVKRRVAGDRQIYVSIPAACDWAPRQGLQVVLKQGRRVTKLGPYDGHLSNADASGNPADEAVVYRRG